MTIQLDTPHPNTPLSALMWASLFAAGCAYDTGDDGEGPSLLVRDEAGFADEDASATHAGDRLLEGELPPPRFLGEAQACHAIVDGYHARGLAIGCATTTHVCPDMLRFAFGAACLQYHAATVHHCAERILGASTCEELWSTSCHVQPVVGSAPRGCSDSADID